MKMQPEALQALDATAKVPMMSVTKDTQMLRGCYDSRDPATLFFKTALRIVRTSLYNADARLQVCSTFLSMI